MNILVEFILKYVKKYNSVSESEEEIYRYGIDIVVYTVLSTLGLLVIGLCWGRLSETALIVGIYYLNQTIGGGYHARSHIGCFLSMALSLVVMLFLIDLKLPLVIYVAVGIISVIFLYFCPVILHPNKAYLNSKRPQLEKRKKTAVAIEALIGIPLFFTTFFPAYGLGLTGCLLSKLYAVMKKHSQKS